MISFVGVSGRSKCEMADSTEDPLQGLKPSIVEIISDKDSTTLGTGFVVTEDGFVVTSRHVITDSQNKLLNSIKVHFHSDNNEDGKEFTASRVRQDNDFKDDPAIDISFLRLDKLPEKGLAPVKLDDKVISLNEFATIGYRKAPEFSGLVTQGNIGILTRTKSREDLVSPEVIQLYHKKQIEPGMSGSPVLDRERNRVVGIITERYKPTDFTDEDTLAFALPVKAMLDLYPGLREKNQGLTVLSKFLRAIGEENSSSYRWIDEVYVPPIEYEEIKESLKAKRIVFITGTKEFGKTFTAVKLMYEYFKGAGYQPRWIHERKEQEGRSGGSDPQELARIREEEDYIKPHQIMYFEDPFGKTEYQRSSDLENYIASIIATIKRVQDAYVIITSREEVFKEFVREQNASAEIADFEKKMNLKRASYGIEGRKEMLLRWAKVNNCKWLLETNLRNLVLEAIENQELLPTPLNIKDFVAESHDILDSDQLRDLMKQKSEETSRRFADEIIRMEEDEKVLFLAFPYLGQGILEISLDIEFVKRMYEIIISDWTELTRKYYTDFEEVKKWFEGDKINTSEYKITFSHPSYYEAFQYAVGSRKRYNDRISGARIRDILVKVLLRLVSENEAKKGVTRTITKNFDNLPANIREQLLLKLADADRPSWSLASAIAANFNKLPSNVQQLLFKLADKDRNAGWWVASAIAANFDNLPANIREQLLLKLSDNDRAVESVASAIAANFDNLPANIREQLLLKLADNDEAAYGVANVLAANFNKLPSNVQQLLFKLADNEKAAAGVAYGVAQNFNKLPSNVQQLLFKLADNDEAAEGVASAIAANFDNLPANIREQLLLKLSDNDRAVESVASAIGDNFNNLPSNVQQLLFKLANNEKAAEFVANAISDKFDKLPPNVREQLLVKLAENDNAAEGVARAITENFNNVPPNVREQLLVKLADKDTAAEIVSSVIRDDNSIEIPDNIRNEILGKAKKVEKKKRSTRKRLSK